MRLLPRSIPIKIITGYTPELGKFKQIKLFSIVLAQFYKNPKQKTKETKFKILPNRSYHKYASKKELAFYLKVNRDACYTLDCLHRWLAVAERMNAAVIIICDNPKLEKRIFRNTWIKDTNLQFITSARRPFRGFINNVASKHWQNAACAHLTSLLHARESGFNRFWNIDADDTLFLCSEDAIISLLKQAQVYAETNNIHLFSLDMWKSFTSGKHWSWGVTFCRTTLDILSIISNEKNSDWKLHYSDCIESDNYNSDWHINSIVKRGSDLQIGTFYPVNTGFIHWGEMLFNPVSASVCKWTDKETIEYPLMKAMGVDELASVAIDQSCIPFNVPTNKDDFTSYYLNNGTWLRWAPPVVAKFFKLDKLNLLNPTKQ